MLLILSISRVLVLAKVISSHHVLITHLLSLRLTYIFILMPFLWTFADQNGAMLSFLVCFKKQLVYAR